MFYFSTVYDEFDPTSYADNFDLKQLYLESRLHCKHSCCVTDATVLTYHCFQLLHHGDYITFLEIKCTFILINGKKKIYGGNKFHILIFHRDSSPSFFNSKPSFQVALLISPTQIP